MQSFAAFFLTSSRAIVAESPLTIIGAQRFVEIQSRSRENAFGGRNNVIASRGHNPTKRRFEIQRTTGAGNLWVIEYVIFYDERPIPTVSIMEFREGKVAHETQYFADRFEAPEWRARWRNKP